MWYNLISDEDRENTEFIYNISYGKDSFAGLHVTIDILGIRLNRKQVVKLIWELIKWLVRGW